MNCLVFWEESAASWFSIFKLVFLVLRQEVHIQGVGWREGYSCGKGDERRKLESEAVVSRDASATPFFIILIIFASGQTTPTKLSGFKQLFYYFSSLGSAGWFLLKVSCIVTVRPQVGLELAGRQTGPDVQDGLSSCLSSPLLGMAGVAGGWPSISLFKYFSRWLSRAFSQHGGLKIVRHLTWWLASPRVAISNLPPSTSMKYFFKGKEGKKLWQDAQV